MNNGSIQIKTAGVIIIGNEILSGKVEDSNSYFLATELRGLGVDLQRISTIPDDIGIIGAEAVEFSAAYDYVFTSGGIGPTHDDVTIEGIAKGFGANLVRHPVFINLFRERYGDNLNEAVLKMAEIPEGAEIIDLGDKRFPLVSFRNIFIFPGIPELLRNKFSAIKERFRTSAFYLKRIFLNALESEIASDLNCAVHENREVSFGSYPILNNPEYQIIITAESKSPEALSMAVTGLLDRFQEKMVVRVE